VNRLRRRLGQVDGERGSALVEFGFIALVVWVPLIYIVAGFSAVPRGVFASAAAAREAGRAMATAPDPATGQDRALRAAALAVEDRAVDATDVRLAYAAAGVGCAAGAGGYTPTLTPGEEFSMCVTLTVRIPMLPEVIDATSATGQFVVERARYVDGRGAGTAVAPHGPNAIPACSGLVAVSSWCLTPPVAPQRPAPGTSPAAAWSPRRSLTESDLSRWVSKRQPVAAHPIEDGHDVPRRVVDRAVTQFSNAQAHVIRPAS
jgi:hypothetical protein